MLSCDVTKGTSKQATKAKALLFARGDAAESRLPIVMKEDMRLTIDLVGIFLKRSYLSRDKFLHF